MTKATKNTLVNGHPDEYFSLMKMPSNTKESINKLSPYATEFFRIFLSNKDKFVKPEATALYKSYDMEKDELEMWGDNVWKELPCSMIKLAVVDFGQVLGVINKEEFKDGDPYFVNFLTYLKDDTEPGVTDPEVWLWICGEKDVEVDLQQ